MSNLMVMLARLAVVFSFFTRIFPLHFLCPPDNDFSPARYAYLVPLVGASIGLCGGLVFTLTFPLFTSYIAAILSVAVMMVITGALHEDGLADMADSLGGKDLAHRVEILHDSRTGTYGVITLFITLFLRIMLIAESAFLQEPIIILLYLIAAHAWSRSVALWLAYKLPCIPTSKIASFFGQPSRLQFSQTMIVAGFIIFVAGMLSTALIPMLIASAVSFCIPLLLTGYCRRKYNGYNGDMIGTAQQLSELAFLLILLAFLNATPWTQGLSASF